MFGANINYAPTVEKCIKLSKGAYSLMVIYLTDQKQSTVSGVSRMSVKPKSRTKQTPETGVKFIC